MPEEKKCSSCGNILKQGFFYPRNTENIMFFNRVVWVEGEKKDIISYIGKKPIQYPFTPYKCESCGHIEFFADSAENWRN